MSERKRSHESKMAFYERMTLMSESLTAEERSELEKWEKMNVTGDGQVGTSDWPGCVDVYRRFGH